MKSVWIKNHSRNGRPVKYSRLERVENMNYQLKFIFLCKSVCYLVLAVGETVIPCLAFEEEHQWVVWVQLSWARSCCWKKMKRRREWREWSSWEKWGEEKRLSVMYSCESAKEEEWWSHEKRNEFVLFSLLQFARVWAASSEKVMWASDKSIMIQ